MQNTSGLAPLDLRIVVKPDAVEEKIGSVYLPDQHKEKLKYAATKAVLVAKGENAFRDWGDSARKPEVGDRVCFAQYSGAEHTGKDGERYVIMNDADLLAVIEADK